jgi:hypothetical protein
VYLELKKRGLPFSGLPSKAEVMKEVRTPIKQEYREQAPQPHKINLGPGEKAKPKQDYQSAFSHYHGGAQKYDKPQPQPQSKPQSRPLTARQKKLKNDLQVVSENITVTNVN